MNCCQGESLINVVFWIHREVLDRSLSSCFMGRRVVFKGKVHKPPTPGAGPEPRTVDWELSRPQVRAQQRREDKAFQLPMDERAETEPAGLLRVWDAIVRFFRTPF